MSSPNRRRPRHHGRGRGHDRDDTPIWFRPPGAVRPRRRQISTEKIAKAALAIADAQGLEAVSMRRIAAVLGVGPMTLYGYVASKRDLLDLLYDAISAETLVPDLPSGWREALAAIARQARLSFQRHPWLLDLASRRSFGSPNMLRHIEQSAAAVAGIDADQETKLLFLMAIDDYALGSASREAVLSRLDTGPLEHEGFRPYLERMLGTGEFPHLEQAFAEGFRLPELEGHFEHGLELLLDGMEAHLERLASGER